MAKKKKKPTKVERHEARIRKARQWVLTYQGKHIVRAYRKRFGVDAACALRDLGEVGALSPEKLAEMQRAERRFRTLYEHRPNSNEDFYYIAGYTSGGAPYGITWTEMGLSPWEFPE